MTYEEIAKFLDVQGIEELNEQNWEYFSDIRNQVEKEAINDGYSQEEAEQKGYDAEEKVSERMYKGWKSSLEETMEYLLEHHNLSFEIIKKNKYETGIKIISSDWQASARKILDTINGVGMFYADTLKEFYETTSVRSYKELVLSHLHWILSYPEVYGKMSPQRYFEGSLDGRLRNL